MSERCVVVGAGGISNAWFPPLRQEQVEVCAVVDLRPEAAAAQIAKYQLQAAPRTDLAATLAEFCPDFVVDLTVPAAHREVTCTALRAGCHVVGEKPLADSLPAAREMIRASEESGKLYMVSQSRRWNERHQQVRETLAGGPLGELTTICCDFYMGCHFGGFRDGMDSPLILDMAIHHFDLLRFMTGLDAVAVYAREYNPRGSWYRGDVAAMCLFELSNGAFFSYRGCWAAEGCHTSWNGDWRFTGEHGTLLYDHDQEPHGEVVAGGEGFNRPLAAVEVAPSVTGRPGGMHGALSEMLHFLRTGAVPQTECHDNLKSLAMVECVIESSRSGARVLVPSC
ncbi:MAG: Gfo/Idh/MocA family oxidoreductase [Fimbriimonadaceae bacterium]|nr:Gfo/Idh/MocA family oxidoreductase [Fimbriimonadaceae bacterium]